MLHTIPPSRKEEYENYLKDMKMIEECIEFAKNFEPIKKPKEQHRAKKETSR